MRKLLLTVLWLCLSFPWLRLSSPWLCLSFSWLCLSCVQDPKTGLSFQFVGRVDFSPMVIRKSAMQQVGERERQRTSPQGMILMVLTGHLSGALTASLLQQHSCSSCCV